MGEGRKVYRVWWKRPKERDHPEDGIRMYLRKIGWGWACRVYPVGSG
jgi:hypothetical protein